MAIQRVAVQIPDVDGTVERFRAIADGRPLGEAIADLIRQYVNSGGAVSSAGACSRCEQERQRQFKRRRAEGRKIRVAAPVRPVLTKQVCSICDATFQPSRHDQKYCTQGNRRCMKYAQRYGVALGRKKYAAKQV